MLKNVSPKVIWPVVIGLVLPSVFTNINLITPEMLNFLGPWKFFVLQTVTSILGGVVGYAVTDPARSVKPAVEQAPAQTPSGAPASAPTEPSSPFAS